MNTSVEIEARPYDDEDVQQMVATVQAEYVVRYGGPDESPVDPRQFDPPDGLMLAVLLDGAPVGMGGWRRIDLGDGVPSVEIKRMYVAESARRRGISRRLLGELETRAAAAGAVRMVLETGEMQPEAIALYESSGYVPTEPFGHYADAELSRHFAKAL